jgi:hypothetical protein
MAILLEASMTSHAEARTKTEKKTIADESAKHRLTCKEPDLK